MKNKIKLFNQKIEKKEIALWVTYKEYIKKIDIQRKEIIDNYENVIKFLNNSTPLESITKFLNKNILDNKSDLVNTRILKK